MNSRVYKPMNLPEDILSKIFRKGGREDMALSIRTQHKGMPLCNPLCNNFPSKERELIHRHFIRGKVNSNLVRKGTGRLQLM